MKIQQYIIKNKMYNSDILYCISIYTRSSRTYLRQVCKLWRDSISQIDIENWLTIAIEDKSISLLQLAFDEGHRKLDYCFKLALQTDDLEFIKAVRKLNVPYMFTLDDIKSIKVLEWLENKGYSFSRMCDPAKLNIDVAKRLCKIKSFNHYNFYISILLNANIILIQEYLSHIKIELIIHYSSIKLLKELSNKNLITIDGLSLIFRGVWCTMEKVEFLLENGVLVDPSSNGSGIYDVRVLDWMYHTLGKQSAMIFSNVNTVDILNWRINNGEKSCHVVTDTEESLCLSLDNLSYSFRDCLHTSNRIEVHNIEVARILLDRIRLDKTITHTYGMKVINQKAAIWLLDELKEDEIFIVEQSILRFSTFPLKGESSSLLRAIYYIFEGL